MLKKRERERPVPTSRPWSATRVLRTQAQIPAEVLKASPGPWSGPRVGFPARQMPGHPTCYLKTKDNATDTCRSYLMWLSSDSRSTPETGARHSTCLTRTDLITEDTRQSKITTALKYSNYVSFTTEFEESLHFSMLGYLQKPSGNLRKLLKNRTKHNSTIKDFSSLPSNGYLCRLFLLLSTIIRRN